MRGSQGRLPLGGLQQLPQELGGSGGPFLGRKMGFWGVLGDFGGFRGREGNWGILTWILGGSRVGGRRPGGPGGTGAAAQGGPCPEGRPQTQN